MWSVCLDTHVCCVQGTLCCDTGGLSSASQPAPPTIESPATPKVQRLSDRPSPRKVTAGSAFPWGGAEKGGLGSGVPVATPVCPAPAPSRSLAPLSPPTHRGRLSRKALMCRGGCLWLPSPPSPFPALRLLSLPFCQARPRWEISLGVFTSHRLLIA